jgi:ribosomal protein S18 acetylase RimI-like enzyme
VPLRPGRPEDFTTLLALWAEDVRRGSHDCVPDRAWLRRQLGDFDWESRSRVLEDGTGPIGFVVVLDRPTAAGSVARLEIVGRSEPVRLELLHWGLRFSRAAGAVTAQVWWPRDADTAELTRVGLSRVRSFWRMDRADLDEIPPAPLPDDYRLETGIEPRVAADTFNRAFADHWRFMPVAADQVPSSFPGGELSLLAVAPDGNPAAVVWSSVEQHEADIRRQPVGLVNVVGTVPDHRRQGLARALTAEALRRLRDSGAASSSLYVDAFNPTRAYELYRRLGFEVGYVFDVFEVSWAGDPASKADQTSKVIS